MQSTLKVQQVEDKGTHVRVLYDVTASNEKLRRTISLDPFDIAATTEAQLIDMIIAADSDDEINEELALIKESKLGKYYPDQSGNFLPIGGLDAKLWEPGISVVKDEYVIYKSRMYLVQIAHTTQSDWAPGVALNLFSNVQIIQADTPPQWVQPDGAGGPNLPYPLGATVTHNGSTWTSDVADNVWEPGVSQWTEVV